VTVRYDFDEIRIGESYADVIMAPSGVEAATNPSPGHRQPNVPPEVALTWKPGGYVAGLSPKHKVFFSENFDDVNDGIGGVEQDVERYPVDGILNLDFGKTYYWRVDEANNTTGWDVGDVWEFTVADYIVVDNFEDYSIDANQIWCSWKEGIGYTDPEDYHGNGTGSAVGDDTSGSTTEETIVHGGKQSMPYTYVNDGTSTNIFGDPIVEYYSEAELTFSSSLDWTRKGVEALSLWFRGYPAYLGSFSEEPPGTYTIVGEGADISGESDQFHFAWKQLSGAGLITARIESVENTHGFAKAGVMIRDTLDADSAHAMVAVTPGTGVWFGRRTVVGSASEGDSQYGITAPYWVKVEHTVGGLARAYYSPDGNTWEQLGASIPVTMSTPMYAGLALTSHSPGVTCQAKFSNVTGDGTGEWANEDIGMDRNEAEPMYVAISDMNGTTGTVYHEDPNAALIDTWTEWNINLKDFGDQNVDVVDVNSIAIGFGDRDNPQAGGSGKMYFDNIRLYPPRCVPSLLKTAGDLNNDCVVDYADLEIMANDWLQSDYTIAATIPQPPLTWWKFDEGSGTTAGDSSGKGHNGVISGATWKAGGWDGSGYCLEFNGVSGEVTDADAGDYLNGLDGLTVSAWVKSNIVGTDKGFIIFMDPDGTDNRDMRYDDAGSISGRDNVIKCGLTSTEGTHETESSGGIQVTAWQHIAMTWSAGEPARIYVNGWLDDSFTDQAIQGGTLTGYTKILVGRGGKDRDGDDAWDGLIDEVRVYDYALSGTEILSAMGLSGLYVPVTSQANISDEEPNNSKKVNFKDFAVLADSWLDEILWPE
jgi:hypothetical protein